ncbi:MAG: hypothetical protein JW969_05535 [Spirochaetales bacterium]|nr:hypothetical protein [Spirochaetales bacterium]
MPKKTMLLFFLPIILSLIIGCTAPVVPAALDKGTPTGKLNPTLFFRDYTDQEGTPVKVAFQAGIPLPGFDPQERSRVALKGKWKKERLDLDFHKSLATRGGSGLSDIEWEAQGRHQTGYNDSAWKEKDIPGVENFMPGSIGRNAAPEEYQDDVWYRYAFTVPEDWKEKRITLNFLAANYIVDAWINGIWVGYHEGGYTPFSFDVTNAVKVKEKNCLSVRVANTAWGTSIDTVPARTSDWFNYTGIIQDVYLEATPKVYIVRGDVKTLDLEGNIEIKAVLHNTLEEDMDVNIAIDVYDTNQESPAWLTEPEAVAIKDKKVAGTAASAVVVKGRDCFLLRKKIKIVDPVLWSPEVPHLYVFQINSESGSLKDSFAGQFGVRTIETEGYRLLLNGKPVFLAGVARHEDWSDTGRTASWDKIKKDLEIITGLNANFVRTGHYPNHVYTYILADRIGLLTEVELPVWQYESREFAAQAERKIAGQMWREMILSLANRPSIIMWGTNNESLAVPERTDYIKRLVSDFHENMEDGRLLIQSAAADRGGPGDGSQELLDVAAWTMYFGIFHGSTFYEGTKQFLVRAHQEFPGKPVLDTEFGIWSSGGGGYEGKQVTVFNDTFKAFTEFAALNRDGKPNPEGFVCGVTWWCAFDWYTEISRNQSMGLFKIDRTWDKRVAEVLRKAYAPLKAYRLKQARHEN